MLQEHEKEAFEKPTIVLCCHFMYIFENLQLDFSLNRSPVSPGMVDMVPFPPPSNPQHFCGHFLWTLFVDNFFDTFFKNLVWTLFLDFFVDTFCRHILWTLFLTFFVDTFC